MARSNLWEKEMSVKNLYPTFDRIRVLSIQGAMANEWTLALNYINAIELELAKARKELWYVNPEGMSDALA